MYTDEAAGHYCNPQRVAELEQQVAELREQYAKLERRLTVAEQAWALAAGIRGVPDMLTPGTKRAARPSQVTGRPGRVTSRTLGHGRPVVSALPQRAPAGGVA
jgi:hypothetical protein